MTPTVPTNMAAMQAYSGQRRRQKKQKTDRKCHLANTKRCQRSIGAFSGDPSVA